MDSTVKRVLTTAKIIFSNGQEYTIPMVNPNNPRNPDLQNYGTKCTLKQSLYKGTSTKVKTNDVIILNSNLAVLYILAD